MGPPSPTKILATLSIRRLHRRGPQTLDGEVKSNWTRVGVAFENKDAKGFNAVLTALPVSGRLEMQLAELKQD